MDYIQGPLEVLVFVFSLLYLDEVLQDASLDESAIGSIGVLIPVVHVLHDISDSANLGVEARLEDVSCDGFVVRPFVVDALRPLRHRVRHAWVIDFTVEHCPTVHAGRE